MLFKLIGGAHVGPPDEHGVRKTYKKGDLVRSDEDLTVKFRGKFTKDFSEHTPPEEVLRPDIPTPGSEVGEEDAEKPVSSKPASKTKVDSVQELDEADEKVEDPTGPESPERFPEPEPQVPANPEPKSETSKYGKKVNNLFPEADKLDIDVYCDKASWYTCVDRDDGEVLNDKKLRKAAVPAFLKKYKE